jgi:drug/metabolite transporter (DMT)-like permease
VGAVAAPALLIILSSTSFITARAVASHADPMLFLFIRFLLVVVVFAILAKNVPWPTGWQFVGHMTTGMVISGIYLAASWWSVAHGLAAGIMTLMGALQPLFSAFLVATIMRTPISRSALVGLGLGLGGVTLVLSPRLAGVNVDGVPTLPFALGLFSVLALTIGTMVQKSSLASADLRATGAVQHLGAAIVAGGAALQFGTSQWDGSLTLWIALAWSVGGLSLAGTSLFVWMVRQGEVTRVTALMLLVPPTTALQAWLIFDEILDVVQLAGFAVALIGVMIVQGIHRVPRRQ